MSNIQPSEKLRVELNNRAKKVLEDMLALATPLHILKGDMFLAEKGKVPASVIGMIYEKALNTYLANPSRFPAVLKGFEEELEKYMETIEELKKRILEFIKKENVIETLKKYPDLILDDNDVILVQKMDIR